jgi:hypothetical protein
VIEKKLEPSVLNLRKGEASDYDLFPALLWLILDHDRKLLASHETLKASLRQSKELIEKTLDDHCTKMNTILTESRSDARKSLEESRTETRQMLEQNQTQLLEGWRKAGQHLLVKLQEAIQSVETGDLAKSLETLGRKLDGIDARHRAESIERKRRFTLVLALVGVATIAAVTNLVLHLVGR